MIGMFGDESLYNLTSRRQSLAGQGFLIKQVGCKSVRLRLREDAIYIRRALSGKDHHPARTQWSLIPSNRFQQVLAAAKMAGVMEQQYSLRLVQPNYGYSVREILTLQSQNKRDPVSNESSRDVGRYRKKS